MQKDGEMQPLQQAMNDSRKRKEAWKDRERRLDESNKQQLLDLHESRGAMIAQMLEAIGIALDIFMDDFDTKILLTMPETAVDDC